MTKILSISGFENSVPFKKSHWPGLEEREYRISQDHDAAAVVIVDGEIVAAIAEERLNRKKHSADFPIGAIRNCLDKANLCVEDIDEIAHGFDNTPFQALYSMDPVSTKQYQEVFSREQLLAKGVQIHHIASNQLNILQEPTVRETQVLPRS